MSYTDTKIHRQERLDRYVARRVLETLCVEKQTIICQATKYVDPVDLICLLIDKEDDTRRQINVEIKERQKDASTLAAYPFAELKVEKYERMKAFTPVYADLYYMVLLNREKALLYNMNALDWTRVKRTVWNIKVTEYNSTSHYQETPMYMIPYEDAELVVNCSEFYDEFFEDKYDG